MKTISGLRRERGWSQFDLALRVGVPLPEVRAWESGQTRPTVPQRHRLAGVFDEPAALAPDGPLSADPGQPRGTSGAGRTAEP